MKKKNFKMKMNGKMGQAHPMGAHLKSSEILGWTD